MVIREYFLNLFFVTLSVALHGALITTGLYYAKNQAARVYFDRPVYEIRLVAGLPGGPKGNPDSPVEIAKPADIEAAVPVPASTPDQAVAISGNKENKPLTTEPKIKEKTPEQILAEARSDVKHLAAKAEAKGLKSVENEIAGLNKSVGSGAAMGQGYDRAAYGERVVGEYSEEVKAIIKSHWRFPALGKGNLAARVEVNLDAGGGITSSRLLQSSGKAEFDASIMRAVEQTKSVPKPPISKLDRLEITFYEQEIKNQ